MVRERSVTMASASRIPHRVERSAQGTACIASFNNKDRFTAVSLFSVPPLADKQSDLSAVRDRELNRSV